MATCLKLAVGTGTVLDQVPSANLTVSFFLRQARGVKILSSHLLLFVVLPAFGMYAGSAISILRRPGDVMRSAIQHFAAGVVFSVVAVELLPDLTATHDIPEIIGGFLAGVVVLMWIRAKFTGKEEPAAPSAIEAVAGKFAGLPAGMLTAIGIDVFLDGLLLGLGISLGEKEGLLLAAALALELCSLGLAVGADLINRGFSKSKTMLVSMIIGLLLISGTGIGYLLLSYASVHVLAVVLSFGCAALLFLVTEELLVEAHEVPETQFTTGMFFGGFLLFLVFGMAL